MGDDGREPAHWWLGLQIVVAAVTVMVGLTIAVAGGLVLGGSLTVLALWWTRSCLRAL